MKTHIRNIYNIEHTPVDSEGEFSLILHFGDREKIHLHFERWWLGYLTRELWAVLAKEEQALRDLRKRMSEAGGG